MWRVVSSLEDGRSLLDGGGVRLIGARYAEPWPVSVIEEIRHMVALAGARSCTIVGAHIGEPLVALAGLCAEVRAYEPDPANCYLLTENMELNGIRAYVRCEAVSSGEGRASAEVGGHPLRMEAIGINRVLNFRSDLVLLLCGDCASRASRLDCGALSLVGGYVFPRHSDLGDKLSSCGFGLSRGSTEALALRPRPARRG